MSQQGSLVFVWCRKRRGANPHEKKQNICFPVGYLVRSTAKCLCTELPRICFRNGSANGGECNPSCILDSAARLPCGTHGAQAKLLLQHALLEDPAISCHGAFGTRSWIKTGGRGDTNSRCQGMRCNLSMHRSQLHCPTCRQGGRYTDGACVVV